jgi:Fic family protein
VLQKERFWQRFADAPLNERQTRMLNRLLDGFEGKLITTKWAKLTKSSHVTAPRSIQEEDGGRSTS